VQKHHIHIAASCDDSFARHLLVALTSAKLNCGEGDFLDIHIIDGNISAASKQRLAELEEPEVLRIGFIEVIDPDTYADFHLSEDIPHITTATFYRYMLPSALPALDKVLYLDCDIVVKGSLARLYETDVSQYYFAGSDDLLEEENTVRLDLEQYCNAGVLLINLKRWREEDIERKLVEYTLARGDQLVYGDQDVLNTVLQSGIFKLQRRYNAQVGSYAICESRGFNAIGRTDAVILHFIGKDKPWVAGTRNPFAEDYYQVLAQTSYQREYRVEYRRYRRESRGRRVRDFLRNLYSKLSVSNRNQIEIINQNNFIIQQNAEILRVLREVRRGSALDAGQGGNNDKQPDAGQGGNSGKGQPGSDQGVNNSGKGQPGGGQGGNSDKGSR
jgi:lipopolysaccharide biosynthesis glycosyltransferase